MPYIKFIDEAAATGELKEMYSKLRQERGNIANIHRVHSLFPEALKAHMDLYHVLLFSEGRELSRADSELIATHVSIENSCDYCASHHGDALEAVNGPACPRYMGDPTLMNLDQRQLALLKFSSKVALMAHAIGPEDHEELRSHGLSDKGILELTLIASYFCFVNRIAISLGVMATDEERSGYKY